MKTKHNANLRHRAGHHHRLPTNVLGKPKKPCGGTVWLTQAGWGWCAKCKATISVLSGEIA